MEIIVILIPISIFLALVACVGYWWAVRSGQFDDLDTPALRMVFDDDEVKKETKKGNEGTK